jgi:hypothetical protein
MPNLKALMARGAYFRESYSVVPQHPHSGEWAENYDSSIPNPILVSGTIFLKPKQQFVQSAFFPLGFTAHIANELTYKAINADFHFTFQAGGNEFHKAHDNKRVDDDENMFWTLTVLGAGSRCICACIRHERWAAAVRISGPTKDHDPPPAITVRRSKVVIRRSRRMPGPCLLLWQAPASRPAAVSHTRNRSTSSPRSRI